MTAEKQRLYRDRLRGAPPRAPRFALVTVTDCVDKGNGMCHTVDMTTATRTAKTTPPIDTLVSTPRSWRSHYPHSRTAVHATEGAAMKRAADVLAAGLAAEVTVYNVEDTRAAAARTAELWAIRVTAAGPRTEIWDRSTFNWKVQP